jgi:cobalamin-dependent methionine synthase I
MPIFSNFIIQLNKETILKSLGYKISRENSEHFLNRMIDEEIEDSFSLIDPKGIYEIFPIQIEKGYTIDIKEGFRISSKKLSKWLGASTDLAVMAVTIGDRLEKKASDLLNQGESARGFILDAIGSHAVERVADLMERKLSSEANFRNKKRFSCGYSDWELSDQKKILDLIGGGKIGIQVTGNSMMIPEKSITAVIGIY